MKKNFKLKLALFILSGFLIQFNWIAAHSISNSGNGNISNSNNLESLGEELDVLANPTISDPKDFVIRRKVNFDNHPEGYYTDAQYKSDWKSGNLYQPNTTQIRTVDGKKVLANFYPKGTWGRGGGLNQYSNFNDSPNDIDEIYLTYRIKFEKDFHWGLSGKLPGLAFGRVQTVAGGGDGPDIGNKGASARLFWDSTGKLRFYIYHHRMTQKYGEQMGVSPFGQFVKDQWHELTFRVVGNDIGKANGILQVWFDGALVATVDNVEMRTSSSPNTIRELELATFMGGADSRFAANRDQYMYMDDVYAWHYSEEFLKNNPSVARGIKTHSSSHQLYTPISGTVEEKPNNSPSVSITSPKANNQYFKGDNISITSNAAVAGGTISKVEFFNGNTLLGTDTTTPYSFFWSDLQTGKYTLTAKATDNKGLTAVSASVNINVVDKTTRSPFGGTAAKIPGRVEAENYDIGGQGVTFYDTDPGNNGSSYRSDDVDLENAAEGNYNVGWMKIDEWLEYTVNITEAGVYNFDARMASPSTGGTFHIECDGVDVTGPLTVPGTGGWDTWTSVKKSGVNLPSGIHVLRFFFSSKGDNGYLGNFNSMQFTKSNVTQLVNLTAPSTNSSFNIGDKITLTANAVNTNGSIITKVEFYNGNTLVGTDTTSPYSFGWANLLAGNFSLTAKATDNKGNETVSEAVNIYVGENATDSKGTISETRLLEGLVSFYEMNSNISGALRDSHGQNHGTSKQIDHVDGFIEKGNLYDGKSSISSVQHSNSLNLETEFTLMADIFRQGNGQEYRSIIVGKTLSSEWYNNQTYSIAITEENKIRIRTNTPNLQDWVSTQTIPLGKWIRVIATYKSGEGYSLYFDKTEAEKSHIISGTITKSDLELTIGSATLLKNAANTRRFEGILDNVGIWNRKLSSEEIRELITTKITYPDFGGNEAYKITTSTEVLGKKIPDSSLMEAKAGDKVIFLMEEEEGAVFTHWSIDGVQVGNESLLEVKMPEKDITLTKHYRTLLEPEIKIVLDDQHSEFEESSNVHIELETKSNDGIIEKVEIFDGEDLVVQLHQDSSAFDWKDIPKGNHQLTARITDANGKFYFSDPVVLKAVDNLPKDNSNVFMEYVIGPNPTAENLNVIFTNLDGIYDFEFRIVSMNGVVQKMINVKPEESMVTIDVSDLNKGMYVLHLVGNGKHLPSKKFIKE